MKKAKQKEFEAIKTLADREFDRLYQRALARMRTDPERKKMLDKFNAAIQKLAARELASSKKTGTGRAKIKS